MPPLQRAPPCFPSLCAKHHTPTAYTLRYVGLCARSTSSGSLHSQLRKGDITDYRPTRNHPFSSSNNWTYPLFPPSGKTIAKHTGLSPRHVWECTERLEQFGLIRREQEPGKVTVYHILGYEPECITKTGCEPECTGGVSQSQDGLCENKHSGCEQTSIGVVNQRAYKEEIEIKTRTLLVGSFASTRRTSKRQLGCSD